jgi:hypothetical protein
MQTKHLKAAGAAVSLLIARGAALVSVSSSVFGDLGEYPFSATTTAE